MTAFEPGEGWRRLRDDEVLEDGAEVITHSTGVDARSWVRVEPVPSLPTEPYTVIRVTWPTKVEGHPQDIVIALTEVGHWASLSGPRRVWASAEQVQKYITGFEVLAEPRRVDLEWAHAETRRYEEVRRETAKAVVNRVIELGYDELAVDLDAEFGVES